MFLPCNTLLSAHRGLRVAVVGRREARINIKGILAAARLANGRDASSAVWRSPRDSDHTFAAPHIKRSHSEQPIGSRNRRTAKRRAGRRRVHYSSSPSGGFGCIGDVRPLSLRSVAANAAERGSRGGTVSSRSVVLVPADRATNIELVTQVATTLAAPGAADIHILNFTPRDQSSARARGLGRTSSGPRGQSAGANRDCDAVG